MRTGFHTISGVQSATEQKTESASEWWLETIFSRLVVNPASGQGFVRGMWTHQSYHSTGFSRYPFDFSLLICVLSRTLKITCHIFGYHKQWTSSERKSTGSNIVWSPRDSDCFWLSSAAHDQQCVWARRKRDKWRPRLRFTMKVNGLAHCSVQYKSKYIVFERRFPSKVETN